MYHDYALFAAGILLLVVSLCSAIAFMKETKRERLYKNYAEQEKENFDAFSTLRQRHQTDSNVSGIGVRTEDSAQSKDTDGFFSETSPDKSIIRLFPGTQKLNIRGVKPENVTDSEPLDFSPLSAQYDILREIYSGSMSRVFLANKQDTGQCVIKFISNEDLEHFNESEILAKLNHISLPQIIDTVRGRQGVFLIERYVEGYSLEEVILNFREKLNERQVKAWGIELAQALNYLHSLDVPIYHCDLKPANIMVTHDNRLVLVDFGVSRRIGAPTGADGLTYSYAAPEQFSGTDEDAEIIRKRFHELPKEHAEWKIDERTDLYSLGVILYQLLTGKLPEWNTVNDVAQYASHDMASVVTLCLRVRPEERIQSAADLIRALNVIKDPDVPAPHPFARRIAALACALALVSGVASAASGVYWNRMESASVVTMSPGRVVVSLQQTVPILVQKQSPNGKVETIEPEKIRWSYSEDNIAKLSGNKLAGINVGTTTLRGQYRDKAVMLEVEVTEEPAEMTEVALQYPNGAWAELYAGDGSRDSRDGALLDCSFISPNGIEAVGEPIYVTDSGSIRIILNGTVMSIPLKPNYVTAKLLRCFHSDLYVLTGAWEDDDGTQYYSFLRYREDGDSDFLYSSEADWTAIPDFAISDEGLIWYIQENFALGTVALYTLEPQNGMVSWKMDLPEGASNLTFDEAGNLYISVPEKGIIIRVGKDETSWTYFAGIENERNFIDGTVPNFYHPTALAARNGSLYVFDFDTVRRIIVQGSGLLTTETLAGVPVPDTNPDVVTGEGSQTRLPASQLSSLAIDGDGRLLLTDPKNSVIYQIFYAQSLSAL